MTIAKSPSSAASPLDLWPLHNLTQFVQDLGHLTTLSSSAKRILVGLLEVFQSPQGALYVLDQGHARYRHVLSQGMPDSIDKPSAIACSHPLLQNLAQGHHIRDASSLALLCPTTSQEATSHLLEHVPMTLAIPLLSRGHMIGFVIIQSHADVPPIHPLATELLAAMTQCAANALDFLLINSDPHRTETLMRRTDRLRSLEIIAAGFAHEVRNPLTSIKTFIQLAPERKEDSQFIEEFSRMVLDDVYRIERLVQEMLDYARSKEPPSANEDLNEIVCSCISFVHVQADRRRIKIEKELASELPHGMVDRQHIQQVIMNLLLNAMDAIGNNSGTIQVRTRLWKPDGQDWVQLEVKDTGCGISAGHLDHIFDPFFTTISSTLNEGTGLGLTIVHQIIKQHGGTVQVQSAEGVGTTVRVQLPCHRQ